MEGREGRWGYLETYLGFILIRYGMVTATETAACEEKFITTIPTRRGAHHTGPQREVLGSVRR